MAENIPSTEQLPTNNPPQNNPPQPNPPARMQRQVMARDVKPGMLFVGRYLFWKHDPAPLVLVSSRWKDGRIAGVNLHNLTLDDMRKVISRYCNKNTFTWKGVIKGNFGIAKGFRTYRSTNGAWLNNVVKVLDPNALLSEIGVTQRARIMTPSEILKAKQQIQQQMRKQLNPKADDLTKYNNQPFKPNSTIPGNPASVPGIPTGNS